MKNRFDWDAFRANRDMEPPLGLYRTCPVCQTLIRPIFIPAPPAGRWDKGTLCASKICQLQRAELARTPEGRAQHLQLIVPPSAEDLRLEVARYTFGGWLSNQPVSDDYVQAMMAQNQATFNNRHAQVYLEAIKRFLALGFGFAVLQGSYGVGKTFLEAVACNLMIDAYLTSPQTQTRPVFSSLGDFADAHIEAQKRIGVNDVHTLTNKALQASLLVFDDIGQVGMRNYDFKRGEDADLQSAPELRRTLFNIFEKRSKAKNKKMTLISVNHENDINAALGDGAAARLSYGVFIQMQGIDLRRKEYLNDVQQRRHQ